MSKLGKKPIKLPEKVELKIENENIIIKGPLGELLFKLDKDFDLIKEDNCLFIKPKVYNKRTKVMWGTLWSLLNNKINDVINGFSKVLILEGLGYTVEKISENELLFKLGLSHPIKIKIPDGINVDIKQLKGQFEITISGINREKIGLFTSQIRKIKPRDIYKLKGFRYINELVKTKPVKKTIGK
ncbi:MAG: 50S ribosomal protein L6 [Candidatus Parcubacteria bacterium]|nr:MAG: 50S ribosomal protein L6 [Candidatus Parcubacteria bacterium]